MQTYSAHSRPPVPGGTQVVGGTGAADLHSVLPSHPCPRTAQGSRSCSHLLRTGVRSLEPPLNEPGPPGLDGDSCRPGMKKDPGSRRLCRTGSWNTQHGAPTPRWGGKWALHTPTAPAQPAAFVPRTQPEPEHHTLPESHDRTWVFQPAWLNGQPGSRGSGAEPPPPVSPISLRARVHTYTHTHKQSLPSLPPAHRAREKGRHC